MVKTQGESEFELLVGSLKFFGTVTASVTHELNNVLSIVQQTAGLLDDLCAGTPPEEPLDRQKVQQIYQRIDRHLDRGAGIIKRLNTFAHSVDEPIRNVDIGALLENLVALMQRLATLKKMQLVFLTPAQTINLSTNPFGLQQAVFQLLGYLLSQGSEGTEITLSLRSEGEGRVVITISTPDPGGELFTIPAESDQLLVLIGGRWQVSRVEQKLVVELFIQALA